MINKLEIVSGPEDAEGADVVVCAPLTSPLMMADNVIDLCSKCGDAIQHRPNAPKKPPKVCYDCAQTEMQAAVGRGEELHLQITEKTVKEVEAFIKKNAN